MNKYWEALSSLHDFVGGEIGCAAIFFEIDGITYEALDTVEELVEKATPKKLIHDIVSDSYDEDGLPESFEYEVRKCPSCKEHLYDESECIDFVDLPYCPYCGQALDWGKNDV